MCFTTLTAGIRRLTLGIVLTTAALTARAQPPATTLVRYPTLHGNTVVFVAHDNLWSVARSGGTATRLTADPGRRRVPLTPVAALHKCSVIIGRLDPQAGYRM